MYTFSDKAVISISVVPIVLLYWYSFRMLWRIWHLRSSSTFPFKASNWLFLFPFSYFKSGQWKACFSEMLTLSFKLRLWFSLIVIITVEFENHLSLSCSRNPTEKKNKYFSQIFLFSMGIFRRFSGCFFSALFKAAIGLIRLAAFKRVERICCVESEPDRNDTINIFHAHSITISISTFICRLIAVRAI